MPPAGSWWAILCQSFGKAKPDDHSPQRRKGRKEIHLTSDIGHLSFSVTEPGTSAWAPVPPHAAFSTKNRQPFIGKDWRDRLHAYMGGLIRALGAVPLAVGGVEDHAHALLGFKATHRICDLLRALKGGASQWIHETIGMPEFEWQEGYGAFTGSPDRREAVKQYIERQEEHHRRTSFQEEYLRLLEESGTPYDERYCGEPSARRLPGAEKNHRNGIMDGPAFRWRRAALRARPCPAPRGLISPGSSGASLPRLRRKEDQRQVGHFRKMAAARAAQARATQRKGGRRSAS